MSSNSFLDFGLKMETIISIKPLMAVLVPLFAPLFIIACKKPNTREGWTFAAATTKFLIIVSMVPVVINGNKIN